MNVVLFAWCPSSVAYLDALADSGVPPRLVVTGPRSSAAAPLAVACARLGVPLERGGDVNAPAFLSRLESLSLDLLLVAGCAQILGPALLALPRVGALNFHPSRLPAYRGKEPLFWAICRGETAVAISVHHLTAEVDGGPILFQREVAVPARATSASLAPLVDREGAALIPAILSLAVGGALPPGAPPAGPGSHHPPLRPEHGLFDVTRPASELDRLVRAAQGEIAVYCFYQGMKLVVLEGAEALASEALPGLPGRVLAIGDDALVVGAAPGAYGIRRFLFLDRVHSAPALAAELGIHVGAAFTLNPALG
jgi:methionyl-tRNA formyltransferase